MRFLSAILFLIAFTQVNSAVARHVASDTVIVKMGVRNTALTADWKDAITSRMSKPELDSMMAIRRPLSNDEEAWAKVFQSKAADWNKKRSRLMQPFGKITLPDTLYVLLGAFGSDDAFSYRFDTMCFDLTAFNTEYGAATMPGNPDKTDIIFDHEFSHLLHKKWAQQTNLQLKTYKDSTLYECIYEGLGMYRSLPQRWLPKNGVIPDTTIKTLNKLYPDFVKQLTLIQTKQNLSDEEKTQVEKHLSRGKVTDKWGAFPVAIWLALEANGDDRELQYWMNKGPNAIPELAKKYLTGEEKRRFGQVYR